MAATAAGLEGLDGLNARAGEGWWAGQKVLPRVLYWGMHAACGFTLLVGVATADVWLLLATFFGRMFFITGAYHRYFAHRTYKTSRAFQFVLAVCGATATQKGPLWWASHHRVHHRYADQSGKDTHTPKDGFYWSHQGWIFDPRFDYSALDQIPEFARYPELRWLNRWHFVPPIGLALACLAIGGWSGLVWGFVVSTVLLWHTTYSINSIAHRVGRRRYATPDDSRNNWLLGLLTLGEGWHNNHHHYCVSTRQGFFWWEVDVTYYLLRGLAALRLVWDLHEPPAHVVRRTIAAAAAREAA